MATFYFNNHSGENIYSQWTKHLQTNSYVQDINSIVTQNRQDLQSTVQNASSEQVRAIQNVCGQLEDGFTEINGHLSDINFNISGLRSEINDMASMLDWKLSILIDEQRVTNQLLGHVAKLLRIPDSQKQRVYYIEQGLKYLKNAFLEGSKSTFYDDSIEGFKEAEKIEKKDYITLKRIGQIYLYSEKYMDFQLSEDYFLRSGREALAEANAGGTSTSNNFRPSDSDSGIYPENIFLAEAAEAYLYAGRTCYLQQKLSQAAEYAGKAYKLLPEFIEAGFEQAKYLAASNQVSEACIILESVIEKDRYFSLKTLNDQDLLNKQPVLQLLENLQKRVIKMASEKLQECLEEMHKYSEAQTIIREIELNISKNTFLSGKIALDLLTINHPLPFHTLVDSYSEYQERTVKVDGVITKPQKLIEFLKEENKWQIELEQKKKASIISNREDRTYWGAIYGAIAGFFIGFYNGCTLKAFSMEWGTLFLTIIGLAVVGGIIGAVTSPSE